MLVGAVLGARTSGCAMSSKVNRPPAPPALRSRGGGKAAAIGRRLGLSQVDLLDEMDDRQQLAVLVTIADKLVVHLQRKKSFLNLARSFLRDAPS